MTAVDVAARVAEVRERIARAGGIGVSLIAVTKAFGHDAWDAARDAGCDGIGENYAQELIGKNAVGKSAVPVHFIGHVQTNKVKSLIDIVDVWQSVDRASVIDEIAKRATAVAPRVFVQVNTSGEESKSGCAPGELDELVRRCRDRGLVLDGLMTIGPTSGEAQPTREAFRMLRRLVDEHGLAQCSMGMSGDLEIAVEEGSTMVRVGSALFGSRQRP
ncbi:MAG: YggS family pyridoxal phosphate-dependent enzyme [Ilumatobacteraceae bacterium]